MKTYTEFLRDLNEFKVGQFFKKYQPLKGLTRISNTKDMLSKDKTIGDRISSGIGIVKPYDIGGMLMKPIFDQGKQGSLVNQAADKLSNVRGLKNLNPNPKTDLGKRLGDKLSGILQRRNQNLGASDLKKTPGMS